MLFQSNIIYCAGAALMIQGNKNSFRGMLAEPTVEAKKDILHSCGGAKEGRSCKIA